MSDHHHPAIHNFTLPILAVQDENATVVVLQTPWGTEATGSSKREPGDHKDYARGYRLALSRALINLGYEMQRQERAAIRTEITAAESVSSAQPVVFEVYDPETDRRKAELVKKYANTPQARAKRAARAKKRAQAHV